MANKSYFVYDKENDEFIPIKLIDAGDGTYRMAVQIEGASFGDVSIGDVEIVLLPLDTFAADAQAYGKGVLVQGDDGTDRRAMSVCTDGHPQVDVLTSAVEKVVKTFSFTPVILATTYASKGLIAPKETLTDAVRSSGGGGVIETVIVGDLSYQRKDLDLVFFSADPDSTVFTLDTMFDIDDADLPKILGVVNIEAEDYAPFKDNAVAVKRNVGLAFNAVGSADIYVALVSRYTVTYASTSDLNIHIAIKQD